MLPGKKNRWTNERKRNRQRTLTAIQLVPDVGLPPPASIAPGLGNSPQETLCANADLPKKSRKRKRKRKDTTEQIMLQPGTSFAQSFTSLSNNSVKGTTGSNTKYPKKNRKKRKKRNNFTDQLVGEPKNSVHNITPLLNNSAKKSADIANRFRNISLSQSNQPETLINSNPLSQNVVNTAKIKREIPDDSLPSKSSSMSEQELTGDCELTSVVRPVRKIKEEVVHNWNEDVVYIGKSVIEKEVTELSAPVRSTYSNSPLPEQLFPTNDELMDCDTVPSSPINFIASAPPTPEEIQFSLLQSESNEPMDHNLKSIIQPLSLLPAYKKDDIFCANKLSELKISNAEETDNLYDFTHELQNICDANFNKDSLTLEELDVCVKVLGSILSHACTNFTSKNELMKSFTTSIQESPSFSHESPDISDNTSNLIHNPPPKSSDEFESNLHLENTPNVISKNSPCEIKEFNLHRLQNISESANESKDSNSLSLHTTIKAKKRPYLDQNNPASCSESFLNTNPTSMPVTKKFCPPPHINPLDPRLVSKNYSASYSETFSNANSFSIPGANMFSHAASHINILDPRLIPKNNFASYTQPTQVQDVEPFRSKSTTVPIKCYPETSSKYNFSNKNGENNINNVLGLGFEKSPEQLNYNLNQPVNTLDREIKKIDTQEHLNKQMTKPFEKSPSFGVTSSPSDSLTRSPIQLSPSIRSPTFSNKPFVNLIPPSLLQDIGVDFIPSSYLYLIAIMWRVEWFSEYESKFKINSSVTLPPILKNTSLSQVLDSYQNEKEYYITYFKLLLVDCWYRLYLSWRDAGQLNQEYHGKIRDCEIKSGFIKYVVEYFVPVSEKDNMPTECFIVELKFTKFNNNIFRALGYVSNVTKRKFDSSYDNTNEAFKILNVSGENILKYKVVIYTVYKCDDIDATKILTHKKLMSIRNVLLQNEALNNLNKSPLSKVILNPITSAQKLAFSVPDENRSVSVPLNQICEHIFTPEPLLMLINSSLSLANKTSAMYYLVKEIQSRKPTYKIVICSKYEKKLSVISNDLQKHGVAFINDAPVPGLEKYSLKRLIERKMAKNPNLNRKNVEFKLLRERSVISILLQECLKFDILKKLKIACCILDDAHEYTEPESVIPLTYGITKFVLFGDKAIYCDATPVTASYGYNRSLFNRANL